MKTSGVQYAVSRLKPSIALLLLAATVVVTGCSTMAESDNGLGYTPETREISDAKKAAEGFSSELIDIIALRGKLSEPGPGVSQCGEEDPEKFYAILHTWSLINVPVDDMEKAMVRLNEDLPKRGWKVSKYGPDASPSKSLELVANSKKKKFSVSVRLFDETGRAKPDGPKSKIWVNLSSACFQVPKGKTVDEY
ncbi:hypothetical protein [Streptomyces sp. H27-D2]|uniref:hypothetical protein n=1 Tax=Streptomyces sp. H27-D2 TaxID=3046304 RepID=UPI002DBF2ACF|nr:hypothetical protein [Streptomyces sp. H27-D2]MEC4017131.1 hypothetical protein [Streptomyces sp. H27-D2]